MAMTSWPQSGHDQEPPVADLARPAARPGRPGRTDRGRRRRPASAPSIARSSPAVSSGWTATSSAIAGSSGCHAPRTLARIVAAGQHRPPRPGRSRRIRAGSMSRRATAGPRLALGRDPGHDERPEPLRCPDRELERGHRAHREAAQVEGRQAERVDERRRDRRRASRHGTRRSASQRVQPWPRASGRTTRKAVENSGDLGREVLPARSIVAPWSMIERRPGAVRLVARSRGRWRRSSARSDATPA